MAGDPGPPVSQRAEQKTRIEGPEDWIAGVSPCLPGPSSPLRVLGRARTRYEWVHLTARLPPQPSDPDPCCSCSLMSGLASLDAKTSSRLGILTVAYYLWTTFVAVIVGIIMVSIIHPGGAAQKETTEQSGKPIMSSADALLDLIR